MHTTSRFKGTLSCFVKFEKKQTELQSATKGTRTYHLPKYRLNSCYFKYF